MWENLGQDACWSLHIWPLRGDDKEFLSSTARSARRIYLLCLYMYVYINKATYIYTYLFMNTDGCMYDTTYLTQFWRTWWPPSKGPPLQLCLKFQPYKACDKCGVGDDGKSHYLFGNLWLGVEGRVGSHVTQKKKKPQQPQPQQRQPQQTQQRQFHFHCCLQRKTLSLFTYSNQIRGLPTYRDLSTQHPLPTSPISHLQAPNIPKAQMNPSQPANPASLIIYTISIVPSKFSSSTTITNNTTPIHAWSHHHGAQFKYWKQQEYLAARLLHHSNSDHIKATHHFRKKEREAKKNPPIPASNPET